uniref:Outer membrane protein Omp28 n=1 Tax=Ignavibacterium album TaxID=591197 RepID=A0A7V3E6K4_9BACT
MKNLLLIMVLLFGIYSCETQPPLDPNKITLKTGEVLVHISFIESSSLSATKIVQLEDFANVSCTPCLISNKIIESVSKHSEYSNQIRVVKFPTNFPSPIDPMYLTAKTFCDYRMSLYQILFAPTIIVDGIIRPIPTDSNQVKNAIQQRLQTSTDFWISDSSEINNNGLIINLNILTKDINHPDLENLIVRIALVESEIEYSSPPGSNGETKFYDVVRTILPSNEGFKLSEIKGQKPFLFENSIDSTWNLSKIRAVTFIQNSATKEIIQSCIHN